MKKLFGILQKVGKSLMLPVAILPAAGILLGIGNALVNESVISYMPFLANDIVIMIASIMEGCGQIIFDNLPLIFAVGVAVGLTDGEGVAALAAIGITYKGSDPIMGLHIMFGATIASGLFCVLAAPVF